MASKSRKTRWAAGIILFVSLIAIVITGFGTDGFGGLGSLAGGTGTSQGDTLVTIEDRTITAGEVSEAVNRQYSRARQQDPTLTMEAFLAQGAYEQVLNQLIVSSAMQQFGARQGLAVSPNMVDREIVNIPAFRNLTGQFDQNQYLQQLRTLNLTESGFRDDVAQSLMQRQLIGPIALGGRAPEAIAREYANLLLERRTGLITAVPAELMAQGIAPTDSEIAAFYRTNRVAFTVPERRIVKYATVGADQVAQSARATDAEIAQVYRNSPRSFGARETRTIQSIVLPTQQAAQDFANRVRGGTDFVAAAGQAGFAAADVTFTDRNREQFAEVANPALATAAFGAAQGAVVGPIRSELGFHVARVDRITNVAARPIETVRGEIAAFVEQRKRIDAIATLVNRVEERVQDGASFEEVARENGLTIVTTPPITAAGQPAAGAPAWATPPELQPLLRAAFDLDPESPEPVVETITNNERYGLVTIERMIPAAPPPLAQIAPQVRAAFIQQRARELARALADRIVQRINAGTPAATAFAEAQPRIPAGQRVDMRRVDISRQGQQVPPPLIALFSIPQGRARVMPAGNGGWFIVFHELRTPGDASTNAPLIQTTRTEFSNSASEEIAQQFARAVQARSNVVRNEEAITRARQAMGGGGAAAR